jgi:hypothetical protein
MATAIYPGQFDDADDDDEIAFIAMMRLRLDAAQVVAPTISTRVVDDLVPPVRASSQNKAQVSQRTNHVAKAPAPVHIPPKKDAIEELYEDDDAYVLEDEDDFMYDDMEDELIGGSGAMSLTITTKGQSSSNMNLSHSVFNSVSKMQDMESSKQISHTGRDDRATSEQCMDPRTRLLLFRLLSSGFLELIDGCLSTGKEANVYYAKAGRTNTDATQGWTGTAQLCCRNYRIRDQDFQDINPSLQGS